MNTQLLSAALRRMGDALADRFDEGAGIYPLRDEGELILVLARVVEGKPLDRAFGAPGDWGYRNPIGIALSTPPAEVVAAAELELRGGA